MGLKGNDRFNKSDGIILEGKKYDAIDIITDIIAFTVVGFLIGGGIVVYVFISSIFDDPMLSLYIILIAGLIGSIIGMIILTKKIVKGEQIWDDEHLNKYQKYKTKQK